MNVLKLMHRRIKIVQGSDFCDYSMLAMNLNIINTHAHIIKYEG